VTAQALAPSTAVTLLGQPLEERALRQGLEKVLRSLAHLATGAEKIRLVDEANRVRPRTLF
jgi:serine/threonine-protein kinase PknG